MRGLRLALGLALSTWAGATCATAGSVQVIKDLCEGSACDRDFSNAALTLDAAGQIFGVNDKDGDNAKGSIFRLGFNADRQAWNYKTIYSFCAQAGCPDGSAPRGKLIADVNGNLYGTASSGGPTGHGTVFRLAPSGQFEVLYGFCPADDSCPDGATPNIGLTYRHAVSGALYDGVSPLYGASVQGGSVNAGTLFQLTPSDGDWTLSVIKGTLSGCSPDAMVMDSKGDIYETFRSGCGEGSISLLHRANHAWTETAIHLFCQLSNCADGGDPQGPVLIDRHGNIFGTTEFGGTQHMGTLYVLSFDGTNWNHSILHSFCTVTTGRRFCQDGAWPLSGVIADASGNLFGTTNGFGAPHGGGTVFEISAEDVQTLHVFCVHDACSKGSRPIAGLVMDSAGNLFGKTTLGGGEGSGTVFELTQ